MSVYAPVPAFADRKRHPRALVLIVAGHAALLAAVMTAKMDVTERIFTPTVVKLIPDPPAPPKDPPPPQPAQNESRLATPTTIVPIPLPSQPVVDPMPLPLPLPTIDPGPAIDPSPATTTKAPEPVRVAPRFNTPDSQVRPPYPQNKLRAGEEAVLRLRLGIDARGRVTAVDPVGAADPTFLAAARRHLLAHWRYSPATEDGKAVATTIVITLRFQLDD
jgi:protein TonB